MQSFLNITDPISANNQIHLISDEKIQEKINYFRSKFRENIGIETAHLIEMVPSKSQIIGHYIHQRFGSNTGKIGSLVKIESDSVTDMIRLEEIGNSLSRQIVALSDPKINTSKLLNSEYLFAPIGTVRQFIEQCEEKLNSKISILDLTYVKIK